MQYRKGLKIVTLSGPAGAGKTTIMKMFLSFRSFKLIESYTTRSKRQLEKDAGLKNEYVFVSQKDFEELIEKERLAWYVKYDEHHYGTLKKSLKDALEAKHISVMILTPETVATLREQIDKLGGDSKKNIASFFIWAPEENLRLRMAWRGDNPKSIRDRLDIAPFQHEKARGLYLIEIENNDEQKPALIFQKIVQEYLLAPPKT